MIYTMQPHSTRYRDVVFRSRLEARWAEFFDLLHWNWQYEPLDLNGWSPDFSIQQSDNRPPILVEVKPLSVNKNWGSECLVYFHKIAKAVPDCRTETLLLGLSPFSLEDTGCFHLNAKCPSYHPRSLVTMCGFLGFDEGERNYAVRSWLPSSVLWHPRYILGREPEDEYGLVPEGNLFSSRISSDFDSWLSADVDSLWKQAGTATQYHCKGGI
jgi:hypothetical protein